RVVKSKKIHFGCLSTLLAMAALAGCASGGGASATKNDDPSVLRTRAIERWDLLIAHKAEKAWDYLSPGYRETKPRAAYPDEMTTRQWRWDKVMCTWQECHSDVCKVHLTVDYKIDMGGLAGNVKSLAPVNETWIRVKGGWYFLPEQFQPTKLGGNS